MNEPRITLGEDEDGFYYQYLLFSGVPERRRLESKCMEDAVKEVQVLEGALLEEIKIDLTE